VLDYHHFVHGGRVSTIKQHVLEIDQTTRLRLVNVTRSRRPGRGSGRRGFPSNQGHSGKHQRPVRVLCHEHRRSTRRCV